MSIPRHEQYKESEVEWLGEVPEHWSILPLLAVGRERDEKNTGMAESNLLSLSYGRIIRKDIDTNEGLLPESFETYQIVYPGDIVFRLTDLQNDKRSLRTAIVEERGIITSAYLALEPLSANPQFLNYLFRAYDLRKVFYAMGSGVRQSMSYEDVKRMEILLPPMEEQVAIARFLDRETTKIDALIQQQRRLIVLLKEKRQAVISRAVTKGLNPSASMKNSGIEWIGSMPVGWQVIRLKMFAEVHGGITKNPGSEADGKLQVPYLRVANVQDGYLDLSEVTTIGVTANELERYRLRVGDVLMNEGGDFDKLGRGAIWNGEIADCIHQNHVFSVRPTGIESEWLTLVTSAECGKFYFMSRSKQSTNLASISRSNIRELPVPYPTVEERTEIIQYVHGNLQRLDQLDEQASNSIRLLEERRSALISAAVTGKINVTAHAAKPVRSTWSTGFARQVLAAETLSRCNGPRMGRIKLQKLIHLCEYHAQLDELGSTYSRKAAGPFDAQAMAGVRKGLLQQRWFEEFKDGGRYGYRPLEKEGGHKQYLPHWEDKQAKIDQVLNLLGDARTRTCEIASTLYAAWNDLLLEGKNPTDGEIIHEASSAERWHESKEKIDADKWPKALEWMRSKGLVPVGYGAHTKHKSEQGSEEPHELA